MPPRSRRAPTMPCRQPELLEPVHFLPTTPWAFLWHFVREGFIHRYTAMISIVVLAQVCQTFDPYILKLLINRVTGALQLAPAARDTAAMFGLFGLMVALWFADTLLVRCYQLLDIYAGPAMRKRVQTRMFGYLLGHSPRYFQEKFRRQARPEGQGGRPRLHLDRRDGAVRPDQDHGHARDRDDPLGAPERPSRRAARRLDDRLSGRLDPARLSLRQPLEGVLGRGQHQLGQDDRRDHERRHDPELRPLAP
ncbi:MAG: hypothetical protein WDO24_16890 [Pseudomonadota bacterium]